MHRLTAEIETLFVEVCTMDVRAIKPGNVSLHSVCDGRMSAEDFIRSAQSCASAICQPGITLGERILKAVLATREVVEYNTNLGIILLCAPLIQAWLEHPGTDLRAALKRVLEDTTVDDAVLAYRAIRLAQPGGMGRVEDADLAAEPTVNLREAMVLARTRDRIAAQYADGYALLFDEVTPRLLEFQKEWGYSERSVSGTFLVLLGRYPDSLVARKYGVDEARKISAEAASLASCLTGIDDPDQFELQLLEFDRRLKDGGINPGTTADLVIAGLLITGLRTL